VHPLEEESIPMLHRPVWRRVGALTMILVLGVVCFYAWAKAANNQTKAASYKVLEDSMQMTVKIGVASGISEKELEATLAQAADDHQNDPARDLLLSDYLWVQAYLLDGEKKSAVPAGKLRRYVPPKQTRESQDWFDWLPDIMGKGDKFFITLKQADQSLQ
jgi:hypothetical protein